jgi:hypothetical protein
MYLASGETAISVMPFSRLAMISAPNSTPRTVPRPPRRLVPPMTQAATASSSMSEPTVDVDAPEYAVCMKPVSATMPPISA